MNWSENIVESLPEPRDDEPDSLRRDIADELADHLQSALARRLVTTADVDRAQAQVLEMFGDPHQIARQLWWDALREKIMSQRIMLAFTALLAVVTLTALGLIWRVVERSQAATLAMIDQAQKANEALLARITALPTENPAGAKSAPAEPARSVDWNPVKAHLTLGAKDGPPATGFTVSLLRVKSSVGGGMVPNSELIAEERTGSDGLVELGLVSPGKYQLKMTAPWGEIAQKSLIVAPASEHVIEIACPPAPFEISSVAVPADLPQDLRDKQIRVAFQFVQDTRTFDGTEWGTISSWNGQMLRGQHFYLLALPESGEVAFRDATQLFTQGLMGGLQKRSPAAASVKLAVGDYYLEGISIAVRDPKHGIATSSRWPAFIQIAEHRFATGGSSGSPALKYPQFFSHAELARCPKFEIEPNKLNEWRIAIPEELLQTAREKLDQPQPGESQEAEPQPDERQSDDSQPADPET